MAIEYPLTIDGIEFDGGTALSPRLLFGGQCGDFVAIRPCGDDKTYLGVLIGEIAQSVYAGFNKKTGKLHVGYGARNPAIFVPDLSRVVFGCESWWGKIKDENHLREISNADIDNVWYVQALKALGDTSNEKVPD